MRFPSIVFLLAALSASAQVAPVPVDPTTMLANLQQMRAKHKQQALASANQAILDFLNAASTAQSAGAFYETAEQITQANGTARLQTPPRDWRKKQEELLRDPAFTQAAQTCLTYMAISMQRVAGATDKQIMNGLMNYAARTDTVAAMIATQPLAKEPVSGNVFARWYNVGDQLEGLENWTQSPLDTDGIYTKTILPWMRKNHDPRILIYWDNKIARTGAAAYKATPFDAAVYEASTKPALLWSRAEDMLAIGQRDKAVNEMYAIIRAYPKHKDVGSWIDELQGVLVPSDAAASPSPAESAAPQ